MGKFYEALRRSGTFKKQTDTKSFPQVVRVPTETAKQSKLDGMPPESPAKSYGVSPIGLDPRLSSVLDPASPAAECFKMLRTKLLVASRERPLRSIMVTSAEPLDGKSLVAANLAISIAQGINEYVMLVDCDLRAPNVHKMFNLKPSYGIQDYLADGTSVSPYLVRTNLKKLTFLPGSRPAPNPSELLCSQKMRLLVEELKSRYDDRYIIFDSPPARFAAETAFLARLMDAVILVVRYGKTQRNQILETIENVGREGILGVVFNCSLERAADYQYYYRYYRRREG